MADFSQHTGALHIPRECIVCTCGEIFRETLVDEDEGYVEKFARHLKYHWRGPRV